MADKMPKLNVEEAEADEMSMSSAAPKTKAKQKSKPKPKAAKVDATVEADPAPDADGVATDASASDEAKPGANPFRNVASATTGWLSQNFPGHENAVFGGVCGLVIAIRVFVIGFWQALFLALCVTVGVAIGQYVDGNPTVVRFVRRFFGEAN